MYIYVCICIYVCVYVFVYTYIHTYIHTCLYIYKHKYISIHIYMKVDGATATKDNVLALFRDLWRSNVLPKPFRGTSSLTKRPSPQDPPRTVGIGLRQGFKGGISYK